MPWEVSDVDRHFKGLSDKEKRMWIHVANGALESGDDDGTACHKANGVVKKNRIEEQIIFTLYNKATTMIEAVRMQVVADILAEADPHPRVEKDHLGEPVIPNPQHFLNYFQDMHQEHIQDALKAARSRWAEVSKTKTKDKMTQAQLQALKHELDVGKTVLKQKQTNEGLMDVVRTSANVLSGHAPMVNSILGYSKQPKKSLKGPTKTKGAVAKNLTKSVVNGAAGNSPLMHHLTNKLFGK
jgi:uncharacterized protein YdaT